MGLDQSGVSVGKCARVKENVPDGYLATEIRDAFALRQSSLVPKRRYEHKLRVFYLVKRWQIAFCQQRGKRDIRKARYSAPNGHEKVERSPGLNR